MQECKRRRSSRVKTAAPLATRIEDEQRSERVKPIEIYRRMKVQ
jgi:hypothetical protein